MKVDLSQLEMMDPRVREIATDLESVVGMELTVTSLRRDGDSGVHGTIPTRAVDVRCWDEQLGLRLAQIVNNRWEYDSDRPTMRCATYHDSGGGAHLHLQSHPNTHRR